jgi:hypothetical protein
VEISDAVNRARGLDSYIGLKLPRLVGEAGFTRPEVMVKQIAELRGTNNVFGRSRCGKLPRPSLRQEPQRKRN